MENFATSTSGYFVVIGPKSPQPLEAERICSAVIQKLQQDPPTMNDADAWLKTVQMVPGLTMPAESEVSASVDSLDELAAALVTGLHPHPKPDLQAALSDLVNPFGITTQLNCLIFDQSIPKQMLIYFTVKQVTIEQSGFTVKSRSCSMALDLSTPAASDQVKSVFGGFAAPKPEACYLRF